MGENSLIGWTHHTMNFWTGCHKVSPGCDNCYIGPWHLWRGKGTGFEGPFRTKNWTGPAKWNRQCERAGVRQRVFTCSLSDFFHGHADPWRDEAWRIIRDTPWLDWLVLTKRHKQIAKRLPADWGDGYANVWLGVTCEHQDMLERLDYLTAIPARVRFISAEPLLGPVDFEPWLKQGGIHWIITGCEKAAKAIRRPMERDWVRDIDKQCKAFGIPHYFKQYYEGTTITFDNRLDGVVRAEFPQSAVLSEDEAIMREYELAAKMEDCRAPTRSAAARKAWATRRANAKIKATAETDEQKFE
jgi:protein gp37